MCMLCQNHMIVTILHVKHELLFIYRPLRNILHQKLLLHLSLLSQVYLLRLHEQLSRLICRNSHRHSQRSLITDLQKSKLHLIHIQLLLLHLLDILYHSLRQLLFLVSLHHPDGIRPKNISIRTSGQLYLFHTGCQPCHMIEIQMYSAYKVIKVALSKTQFHSFYIIRMQLKCVDYLQHKKEGRRRAISFFILLLC